MARLTGLDFGPVPGAVSGERGRETVTVREIRYCGCGQRLARDHAGDRCGLCERRTAQRELVPPEVPAEFWETPAFRDAFDAQHIGLVARAYRRHPFHVGAYGRGGIPQTLLGGWLGLTQAQVSRIENGPPLRNLDTLAQWARVLRIPPALLWFKLPGSQISGPRAANLPESPTALVMAGAGRSRAIHLEGQATEPAELSGGCGDERLAGPMEAVHADQRYWRTVRQYLNHHRSELAAQAAALYPPELQVGGTTLIAPPSWLPDEPVDLADITMTWGPDVAAPRVTGTEPETRGLRPLRVPGQEFDRYTAAIRYLDPPRLFENRPSYRLLDLSWDGGTGAMRFGLGTYFAKLDISEAVGHEIAEAASRRDGEVTGRDLPFRSLIGDPFDVRRRAILPAVTTLTLRRTKAGAGFLLHWRDPAKVATATQIFDVIPAGEFQPSSIAPHDLTNDFDIWKNIVRELSEELLGTPDHDGSRSEPIDYPSWPLYRALCKARAEGRVLAVCLGVGLDALTLAGTNLTAVVIDADVFDELLGDAVLENSEGTTVFGEENSRRGIDFSEGNVKWIAEREPVAAPGAACLALAWRIRSRLLAR
jgi:transcriptional regulator with XRE-family HTH domain